MCPQAVPLRRGLRVEVLDDLVLEQAVGHQEHLVGVGLAARRLLALLGLGHPARPYLGLARLRVRGQVERQAEVEAAARLRQLRRLGDTLRRQEVQRPQLIGVAEQAPGCVLGVSLAAGEVVEAGEFALVDRGHRGCAHFRGSGRGQNTTAGDGILQRCPVLGCLTTPIQASSPETWRTHTASNDDESANGHKRPLWCRKRLRISCPQV